MYALIHYGQEDTKGATQFAISQEPRILKHVVQSALRGGMDYLGCEVGTNSIMFRFREDTGLRIVDHWAHVMLTNWDAIEAQAAHEFLAVTTEEVDV